MTDLIMRLEHRVDRLMASGSDRAVDAARDRISPQATLCRGPNHNCLEETKARRR
jgi:hypothetical protein